MTIFSHSNIPANGITDKFVAKNFREAIDLVNAVPNCRLEVNKEGGIQVAPWRQRIARAFSKSKDGEAALALGRRLFAMREEMKSEATRKIGNLTA